MAVLPTIRLVQRQRGATSMSAQKGATESEPSEKTNEAR